MHGVPIECFPTFCHDNWVLRSVTLRSGTQQTWPLRHRLVSIVFVNLNLFWFFCFLVCKRFNMSISLVREMNSCYRKWKHFHLDETLTGSSQNIMTSEQSSSHSSLCVYVCSLILLPLCELSKPVFVCALTYLASLLPSQKNNYHHFPCNETLQGPGVMEHTYMSWHDSPHQMASANMCLMSMTLCLLDEHYSHPWENISPAIIYFLWDMERIKMCIRHWPAIPFVMIWVGIMK